MFRELGHSQRDTPALAAKMSVLPGLSLKTLCSWCNWSSLLPERPPLRTEPRSLDPRGPGTLRVLSALHLSSPGPARKSHLCRVKNPLWKNVHGCGVLCGDLCVVFKFPSGGEARWTVKSRTGKDVLSPGRTASPSPEQGGHWRCAQTSRNCLLTLTARPEVADRTSFSPFLGPLWVTCSIVDWTLFKNISSNITQSQPQELCFTGTISVLFNFVGLNSTMVCTAESFYKTLNTLIYPFNAPMKLVPSAALSVLYGAVRKTHDCFQKACSLLTCSRWNNQVNRISSSMSPVL